MLECMGEIKGMEKGLDLMPSVMGGGGLCY
jgi:hypothetical protein